MNLPVSWRPRSSKRGPGVTPDVDPRCEATPIPGLADLQSRLNHWSHLWSHDSESATRTEAQEVVADRLARWIDCCFGQNVQNSLRSKGSQISLASSAPIFTAFLGRRAAREVSRRILQDI